MVLESFVSAAKARKKPIKIMFMSIMLASVAMWLSYVLFKESASILSIAFVSIGFMPIFHNLFVVEEAREVQHPGPTATFLARHFSLIKIYGWFFIGLTITYAFWYVVLPTGEGEMSCLAGLCAELPSKQIIFEEQEKTWGYLTGNVVGFLSKEVCLDPEQSDLFLCSEFIYSNNALVLGLAILSSFLYGAGAIFLIGWNASVIGVFIGKEILSKSFMAGVMRAVGYLPHGLPEIIAYFIGAIAGGLISAALCRGKYKTKEFESIAKDVLFLTIVAYIILLLAAFIESWLIVSVVA